MLDASAKFAWGVGSWMELTRRRCTVECRVCVCAVAELLAICLSASAFMHADTGDGHLAVCADCAEACKIAQDRSNEGFEGRFAGIRANCSRGIPVLRRCTGSS